jgi:hypothetical protein
MIDTLSREFLDSRLAELRAYIDTRLAALETRLVVWLVGTVGLAALINHWWK